MKPSLEKLYIGLFSILAVLWIVVLTPWIRVGIVGIFLLIIFTAVIIMSLLRNPPDSGFISGEDRAEGSTEGYDRW